MEYKRKKSQSKMLTNMNETYHLLKNLKLKRINSIANFH